MKQKGTLFEQLQLDDEPLGTSSHNNWRESNVIRISVILATVSLCGLFFPNTTNYVFKTEQNISSLQGLPWQYETIRAEYSFPITKTIEQIDKEKRFVQDHTAPVFTQITTQTETTKNLARALDTLKNQHNELRDSRLLREIQEVVSSVYSKGLINIPINTISSSFVSISLSKTDYIQQPITEINDKISLVGKIQSVLKKYVDENTSTQYINDITSIVKPNLIYSADLTMVARQQSADNVRKTLGLVRKGEIVVAKGEIINTEIITKMKSYGLNGNYNIGESTASTSGILGAIMHSGLVYSILILFLSFLRKKIYSNNASLISISSMVITVAFLSWVSLRINSSLSLEYLIIIPVFSMLSAIFFDSRTGFTVTVTMALMLAGVRGNDYTTGFAMLLAGTLGAYSVRDLQHRNQIFRSLGLILIGFVAVIVTITLERNLKLDTMYLPLLSSLINAAATPMITFGVIAIMEKYLNVSTDLKLSEYDNLNHPLLIEMNEKAPGTYQHTLAIAHLVETAAFAIEANPLLARVGAYFHDIGKIPKAEYFIENQIDMENKHDHLSPTKSASIIRNHIEDGIELAKEYKLPQRIIDFIPMHHGTSLIKHFYAKAQDLIHENEKLDETAFRYPGPKPNTKETAILMLADSVEAISRTVDDREDLDIAIDKIFKDKIQDGQLDECELTMRELQEIRQSFVKNLVGVQHQRIQYKEIREN